jgi:hypothetical protein
MVEQVEPARLFPMTVPVVEEAQVLQTVPVVPVVRETLQIRERNQTVEVEVPGVILLVHQMMALPVEPTGEPVVTAVLHQAVQVLMLQTVIPEPMVPEEQEVTKVDKTGEEEETESQQVTHHLQVEEVEEGTTTAVPVVMVGVMEVAVEEVRQLEMEREELLL